MRVRTWLHTLGGRAYWEIVGAVALLVGLALVAAGAAPAGGLAVLLLLGVAAACVQAGIHHRDAARHASIRADIDAGGGLGKRVTV